jgi:hypothetical protein
MREDVDLGIIPGDKAAVVPDLFRGLQHTLIIAMRGGFAGDAERRSGNDANGDFCVWTAYLRRRLIRWGVAG